MRFSKRRPGGDNKAAKPKAPETLYGVTAWRHTLAKPERRTAKRRLFYNAEKFYICVSGAISFSASVLLALARTAISIASAGRVPAAVSSCAACRAISANAVS